MVERKPGARPMVICVDQSGSRNCNKPWSYMGDRRSRVDEPSWGQTLESKQSRVKVPARGQTRIS